MKYVLNSRGKRQKPKKQTNNKQTKPENGGNNSYGLQHRAVPGLRIAETRDAIATIHF